MLVSTLFSPAELFGGLRAVVVDEVHAFAGDDRGWHLLAVLERLTRIAGRLLQRIGLSATVGNPAELLGWLQGSSRGGRAAAVVAPPSPPGLAAALELDYVGSVANAATVIGALHTGEKRLVFADSRRTVEALAVRLRERGARVFVSHSSLSVDERRRAEQAFAEARDCVIVATSTLELGIDVGDLDRVLQVGAPRTVASLLQRLGRSGRRTGTARSMLLLATNDDELLRAAGLLRLYAEGYVEPVVPPALPRHLLAQQLLALCLQHGRVGRRTWLEHLGGLELATSAEALRITDWMLETGQVDTDSGMLFVGPAAERRYGRRHFLELLSVFTADPQFTVTHGRVEIGTVDPLVMTRKTSGPRVLSLGGRSWQVTYIDWARRRAFVEPAALPGSSRWSGMAQPLSFALTDAMRRVVLDADLPGTALTRRATHRLAAVREELDSTVDNGASLVVGHSSDPRRWWTWAGGRANSVLATVLADVQPGLVEELTRYDNRFVGLQTEASPTAVRNGLAAARNRFGADLADARPEVSAEALRNLKFAELLPPELAGATLGARSADYAGAAVLLERPVM
jgi:ATP-dependent Lhr-like helicase